MARHGSAVVGISAGGRTTVTMAARHPELVERVILRSLNPPWFSAAGRASGARSRYMALCVP
ncbi:alpha/beta hydrolase-fold protein [Nonomuraea sp. NPDC050786]|uniref:alpha/beta hydrolase-fold protein n=1 Tax=Nonomuraea sp. NPDC050786 TaxID=3154840 RepID=UPI0033F62329